MGCRIVFCKYVECNEERNIFLNQLCVSSIRNLIHDTYSKIFSIAHVAVKMYWIVNHVFIINEKSLLYDMTMLYDYKFTISNYKEHEQRMLRDR